MVRLRTKTSSQKLLQLQWCFLSKLGILDEVILPELAQLDVPLISEAAWQECEVRGRHVPEISAVPWRFWELYVVHDGAQ